MKVSFHHVLTIFTNQLTVSRRILVHTPPQTGQHLIRLRVHSVDATRVDLGTGVKSRAGDLQTAKR